MPLEHDLLAGVQIHARMLVSRRVTRNHPHRVIAGSPSECEHRPLALRLLPRMLVTIVVTAAALLALSAILAGVDISGFGAAVALAAVAGIVNALLWPLIVRIALPLTVLTLGLGALVLNGLVLLLAASIVPGVDIDDVWSAVVLYVGMAAVVTGAAALLAIDDDMRVLRPALKGGRSRSRAIPTRSPGCCADGWRSSGTSCTRRPSRPEPSGAPVSMSACPACPARAARACWRASH